MGVQPSLGIPCPATSSMVHPMGLSTPQKGPGFFSSFLCGMIGCTPGTYRHLHNRSQLRHPGGSVGGLQQSTHLHCSFSVAKNCERSLDDDFYYQCISRPWNNSNSQLIRCSTITGLPGRISNVKEANYPMKIQNSYPYEPTHNIMCA